MAHRPLVTKWYGLDETESRKSKRVKSLISARMVVECSAVRSAPQRIMYSIEAKRRETFGRMRSNKQTGVCCLVKSKAKLLVGID